MSETNSGTISITPDGRSMSRQETVTYLKKLSEHILAQVHLESERDRLKNELVLATRTNPVAAYPPEPEPPVQDPYSPFTLIAMPVFLVLFFFLDYSIQEKALIIGVPALVLILSLIHHHSENKKAMEEWQQQKIAYEKEKARIKKLNSTVSNQDSKEVVAIKNDLGDVEKALERLSISKQDLENENVLAKDYRKGMIPCVLYSYFLKGRANTLTEAINLYHTELHRELQQQNMQNLEQEMQMHQEALMRQQNLNAARLSVQIENAKNEIEVQSALETLYTVDTLERLIRVLS